MSGLAVLLAFQAGGTALQRVLGLAVPGPVLGFFLLWGSLQVGIVPVEVVEPAADLLLKHLLLLFTPVVVGILPHLPLLKRNALALATGVVVGTAAVLLVTGWAAQLLLARARRSQGGR